MNSFYFNAFMLAMQSEAKLNWGSVEVRSLFAAPTRHLISLENLPVAPLVKSLNFSAMYGLKATQNINQMTLNPSAQAAASQLLNAGGSSNGPRVTMGSLMGNQNIGGVQYEVPSSSNSSSANSIFTYSGRLQTATGAAAAATQGAAQYLKHKGLLWRRDHYYYNDYVMIQDFARQLARDYDHLKETIDQTFAQPLLKDMFINTYQNMPASATPSYHVAGLYGDISIPNYGHYMLALYYRPDIKTYINNILNMPFKPFSATSSRPLNFSYNFVCNTCLQPAKYNATFSYQSISVADLIMREANSDVMNANIKTFQQKVNNDNKGALQKVIDVTDNKKMQVILDEASKKSMIKKPLLKPNF